MAQTQDPQVPGAAAADQTAEDYDVSQRTDVAKLRKHAVGLGGVLFLTVTGSAPISAMLFNVPIMVLLTFDRCRASSCGGVADA